MTRVLRLVVFAIAIAGAIDPAVTLSGAARARVAVVSLDAASDDSASIRDRITADLSATYEVVPAVTSDTVAAVVIGERYPDEVDARSRLGAPIDDGVVVTTVSTSSVPVTGARIVHVDAPRDVPAATALRIDVDVAARGAAGQTTDAVVTIAGLEVGRASHTWTAASEFWRASLGAVPVGEPPYVVRIQAGTAADVVVGLRRDPIRVEFYDPRPSWAATFVRRALEADPRFQVSSVSSSSRGISTRTGEAVPVTDPRLDAFDAVIVGGLDRLSTADAGALERYMRERGGAVVVLPDQRIDNGPARELIGLGESGTDRLDLAERLLEQPAKLAVAPATAAPQASELLVFRALSPASDVIAGLPDPARASGSSRAMPSDGDTTPVIVRMPRGDGRLLLSGAMDAWRYRAADNAAFDRFWQSAIAGLALSVPPPIAIDVDPPLLRPGEPGTVIASVRARDVRSVSASIDGQPLRLLPAAERGMYRASFVSPTTAGRSTIEVRAASGAAAPKPSSKTEEPGPRMTRQVVVRPDVQRLRPATAPSLSLLAQSHRGIDVTPDRIPDLEHFLSGAVSAPPASLTRHPMRSTWWMLPFALCLSAEWWLRRRRGLR